MSTEIVKTNLVFKPYIIGISGGSASGKTSVSREIFNRLGIDDCMLITMDSYYRVITKEEEKTYLILILIIHLHSILIYY